MDTTSSNGAGQGNLGCLIRDKFRLCSNWISQVMGSPWAFGIALFVVASWAITGPLFHYSNTWQLVINTATTIVTFLMVFLIQNTQNRDAKAMHLKLDELLRAVRGARTTLMNLESLTDDELDRLQKEFDRLRSRAEKHIEKNRAQVFQEDLTGGRAKGPG
jgi:low affinity Fe/Cu permease